jgi:hypothetical protein
MPPAVHDKACRSDDVHPLVAHRLAGELAARKQEVGEQYQERAGPADGFDDDLLGVQTANLRST